MISLRRTAVASVFVLFSAGVSAQVVGAGSSLVRELLAGWGAQFGAAHGGLSYSATGSSAGVKSATDGSVDFGASDVPLTPPALKQAQLRQVPLAATAVAIFVNLPQLGGKPINLSGDVLAEIYRGNIQQWDHSQIKGINPGTNLPNTKILPVWRSDGSGQSVVLTTYLSRHSSAWRRSPGVEPRLKLSVGSGVVGGKAVNAAVAATQGAIGYDAVGEVPSGMVKVNLLNAAGKYIAPTEAAIREALDKAVWSEESNAADLDGSAGASSYPMTAVTYALVPLAPAKGRVSAAGFLATAVTQGDAGATKEGFVPLPATAKALVSRTLK